VGKWTEIELPFSGVYRPSSSMWNPAGTNGAFYSLMGWRIKNGVLCLTEGEDEAFATQTYDEAESVAWLMNYSTNYYYMPDKALRKITASTESEISSTFMSSAPTTRVSSVQFRDRLLLAHQGEGLKWIDPSDDTFRSAGITAPTTSPTAAAGAAGLLTGRYRYCVTFVDDQGHESNTYLTNGLANYGEVTVTEKQVGLTSVPLGATGVVYRRIYRTISQGVEFLYLDQIDDNTTETYTDNIEDTSLGSPLQYDNTNPPANIRQIFCTSNRVYLVDGSDGKTLWCSKIDPFTATPDWEHYPTNISIQLPFDVVQNPFQAGFELNSFIYAASKHSIHRVMGDSDTGVVVRKVLDHGLIGRFAFCLLPFRIAYITEGKHLMIWDGDTVPVDVGINVQDILSEMLEPSGLYEPSIIYDEEENFIQVYFNTSTGLKSVRVDISNGSAWDSPTSFQIPLYVKSTRRIIGTYVGETMIHGEIGYKDGGTRRTVQTADWHSMTPSIGNDLYFSRLRIEAKATPITSYVPPTLKVEISLNDSPIFYSKYVDLSRDNLAGSSGNDPMKKIMFIPIHKRAESVHVKISSVNNSASLDNGVEIYRVSLEVESQQTKQDHRVWTEDREQ
jgi:hypothetical protein